MRWTGRWTRRVHLGRPGDSLRRFKSKVLQAGTRGCNVNNPPTGEGECCTVRCESRGRSMRLSQVRDGNRGSRGSRVATASGTQIAFKLRLEVLIRSSTSILMLGQL